MITKKASSLVEDVFPLSLSMFWGFQGKNLGSCECFVKEPGVSPDLTIPSTVLA